MIQIEVTPLAFSPRRGVARALLLLLQGLAGLERPEPVVLLSPAPLPAEVPPLDGLRVAPSPSPRAFRRREIPRLVADARILVVPWAAVPRVPCPTVPVVHELPFVRLGNIEGRVRAWRHRRALATAVRRAACLLVPSGAVREDLLAEATVDAARVVVLPHAFDPSPWVEAATASVQEGAPATDVLAIGTGAGAAGPRKKGMDVLAHVARTLPDVRFAVVGKATWPFPANVEVHAGLEDAGVARLLATSRLLIHPARSEGFGYPPLEAMAAGVPVVAARAGAIPEVVGDAALLVEPGDEAAWTRAVRRALDDEDLRASLVRAGRARVATCSPSDTARLLLEILAGVGS